MLTDHFILSLRLVAKDYYNLVIVELHGKNLSIVWSTVYSIYMSITLSSATTAVGDELDELESTYSKPPKPRLSRLHS